ncbi:MAG: PAS domain-containing protein, partial [Opitutaceae bacterium]
MIEKTSITLASALIAIGLATWVGWALQIGSLLQPFGNLPPTKANEAICWLLLGSSLLVSEYGFVRYSWIASIAALIGLLSLGEYVTGADLKFDELLAKDYLLIETAYAGRMASMSAGSILLGGIILAWRALPYAKKARLFAEAVCGSIIFSVGLSTLLGYAANLPAVYRWGSSTATGIASGLALLLLGTALLISAWRVSYREEGGPPIWSPMPFMIAWFTMTVILWIGMRERELLFLSNNTQNSLNGIASMTDIELKQIANEVENHLSSAWSRTPADMAPSWDADATSFYELRNGYGCVSVGWVDPSWRTRWIFPREGNEASLSFDHMSVEARANAIRAANEKKRAVISQSVSIPQNQSLGFIVYSPVMRENQLAGCAFAEFTYKEFFGALDRKLKISANYDYLVVINGVPVSGNLQQKDFANNSFSLEFSAVLQERRIRFSLVPNESNLQRNRRYLPELTLFSGLGITLLLGLSVHFARTARSGMLAAEQSNRRLLAENDERRRIEERLKISDERLRLALDSTGIGIFEWNMISGYVYYSAGLWIMLGYEPNRMAATVDSFQILIHPEDLPHFRRRVEAQLSGSAAYIDPEFRVRTRSDDWRWVHWRARSVAMSPTGAPIRILGTLQDVTSRREAEEALRTSQAATRKLSLVASRTDNLVVIFTPDGRVEWVNESFTRAMEYPLAEIAGKRLAEFLAGTDTDPRSIGRVRTALSHGQPISTDIVQYSKTGRKFHLSYDIQPVRNKSSEIENFIAVAFDITARVDTEQALRRAKSEADAASRAKSEFLASMSHEIRTPMNGVIGMTSLLLETKMSQEQREFVNTIRNSGEALLTIINDILDF